MLGAIFLTGLSYVVLAAGLGGFLGEKFGQAIGKSPRVWSGVGALLGLATLAVIWKVALDKPVEQPVPSGRPAPSLTVAADDPEPDWDDDRDFVAEEAFEEEAFAEEAFAEDEAFRADTWSDETLTTPETGKRRGLLAGL